MTKTITDTMPGQQGGLLMDLIVALLAPMFLGVSRGNARMARLAAIGTVNDFRARNGSDLIVIAQIIAFGLAAVSALSRSMDDDVSVPLALSLQRSALAMNHAAEQHRRVIERHPDDEPIAPPSPEKIADEPFMSTMAADQLAAESDARLPGGDTPFAPIAAERNNAHTTEKRHQAMWATMMVKEASEITASIPGLPPEERRVALIRAASLTATANEILTGVPCRLPPPPGQT